MRKIESSGIINLLNRILITEFKQLFRGGSEAIESNKALAKLTQTMTNEAGLTTDFFEIRRVGGWGSSSLV
ncbi:MAG: hypothetical protein H7197_01170 [Vitreoscilla sp.]|nr:hypothetical protein [Polaromonas sp.]